MLSLSILLVDDEPGIQATIKAVLESAGHRVTAVGDMPSALRQLRENDFDVVVTDLMLGPSHGTVVMQAARAKTPPPRLVAMSGGSLLVAGAMGADAILEKPFNAAALLATVEAGAKQRKAS